MSSGPTPRSAAIALAILVMFAASPVSAALPPQDRGTMSSVVRQHDVLIKPHGWLQFDQLCAFGAKFGVVLDRLKRGAGRVIVRGFDGESGNPYRPALPSILGLDCMPFSVGFD